MGITLKASETFRVLVMVVIAGGLSVKATAQEPNRASIADFNVVTDEATSSQLDELVTSPALMNAVYSSFEKAGIVQVADRKIASNVVKTGNETIPSVEAHVQSKGTSSDKIKKQALAELPLDKLSSKNQARVQTLLGEVGYFRRLPTTVFATEPEVYQFFVRYPDAAVSIWRVMGISEMQMWQTGANEYEGDSGDGSTGIIDVLYRSPDTTMILCEGQYQSPILKKPIKARSLVLLKSNFSKEPDGTLYVTHRADMYVTFPSQTIETAARILSPVTGAMADRTFSEMSLFLRMMSLAMTRRPAWVEQISGQMEGIPEIRKTQLRQLSHQVHNAERKRQGLPPVSVKHAAPRPPAKLPDEVGALELPRDETASVASESAASSGAQDKTVSIQSIPIGPESEDVFPEVVPMPEKIVEVPTNNSLDEPLPLEIKPEKPSTETAASPGATTEPKLEPGYQFIPKKQKSK